MPTPYLKKVSKETEIPLNKVEKEWDKAKSIVSNFLRKSSPYFWRTVVNIFKRRIYKPKEK